MLFIFQIENSDRYIQESSYLQKKEIENKK